MSTEVFFKWLWRRKFVFCCLFVSFCTNLEILFGARSREIYKNCFWVCSNCKSSLYVLLPDHRGFFYSEWRRKLNFCDVFLWVVVKLRNFVTCVSGREIFKHCFWVWSYTYGALHEDKGLFLVALVSKNSYSLYFCEFFAVFVKFSFSNLWVNSHFLTKYTSKKTLYFFENIAVL